jgi:hypothetical protein
MAVAEALAWRCLSPDSASPQLKKLYSLERTSGNDLLPDLSPFAVVNLNDRLLAIYGDDRSQGSIPSALFAQMKPWVYFEMECLEGSMLWNLINEKLISLQSPFHLLGLHSKLIVLVQEKDASMIEFFLTRVCGLYFLCPLFEGCSPIDSRNYSILNSLLRHHPMGLPQSLNIHCLGAEPNECEHLSQIPHMYRQLLTVLRALGVHSLSIHFVGPNLRGEQYDSLHLSPPTESASPLELRLFRFCGLYHDYFLDHRPAAVETIDLLICFNAGLWGYTDWIPTLQLLSSLSITQTVITSYTLQESEEDFDVIEEHCGAGGPSPALNGRLSSPQLRWNFESELNPHRVREPMTRSSAPPSAAQYFDNNYWQSFSLVRSEDGGGDDSIAN